MIDELISTYVTAAIAHGRASEDGDHETANAEHDRLVGAYRRLRALGPDAQRALLALLDHADPAVRSWAGAHALEFVPQEGERTLTELVAEGGIPGFNAEMTLDTWRDGNLRFP